MRARACQTGELLFCVHQRSTFILTSAAVLKLKHILGRVKFVPGFSPSEVSQLSNNHLAGCWILYLKLLSALVSHRTQIDCFSH